MKLVRDFANRKFFLECAQITLERVQGPALLAMGPGELWQDEQGILHFKIFLLEGFSEFMHTCYRATEIGEVRKEEEYFTLRASDSTGATWHAHHVWPSSMKEIGIGSGMIVGRLSRLFYSSDYPLTASHWVELRFQGNLNYPPTLNHERIETLEGKRISLQSVGGAARVTGQDYTLTFYHQDSHTVVRYEGPKPSPVSVSLRIQEALQFSLASLVDCLTESHVVAGSQSEVVTLSSPRPSGGFAEGHYPPLRFQDQGRSQDFWNIFKCYFEYICHGSPQGFWHPLSIRINEIIGSRRVSLPSEALALCVGIEGIAKISKSRLSTLLTKTADDMPKKSGAEKIALEEAIQIIEKEPAINCQAKDRILGVVRSWLGDQPMDLVASFLESRGLPIELFQSWKQLRMRGAHGSGTGSLSAEDSIKLRNEVLHLFYALVLAIIGYEGAFSDYSQPGWPIARLDSQIKSK